MANYRSIYRQPYRSAHRSVKRGSAWGSMSSPIEAKVGTFTTTSDDSQTISGLGMTPQLLFPFTSMSSSDVASSFLSAHIGWALGASNQGCINIRGQDAQTTSATDSIMSDEDFIRTMNVTNGGTSWIQGALSAIGDGEFTVDWSTTNANRDINYAALSGFAEANVTYHQMSTGETSFAHGLTGGAPDVVLFFSINNNNEPTNNAANAKFQVGAYDGTNQFLVWGTSEDNETTTDAHHGIQDNGVLANITDSGAISKRMFANSMDATNVNCDHNTAAGGTQWFAMLAIRGVAAQVGLWDTGDGSTDTKTIYTPGIEPKLFMPFISRNGVGSVNTQLSNVHLGIGASDGTTNASICTTDDDSVTTTESWRNQQSDSIESITGSGALAGRMTASFSGQSVDLDVTANTSNWLQGAYIVFGQETTETEVFASVGTSTIPTSTGTKAVTDIGFQPKVVMPFGVAGVDGTETGATLGFGAATSASSRGAIAVRSADSVTTSNTERTHDDTVVVYQTNAVGTPRHIADLDSFNSDGFTLDWTTVTTAEILNHICLGGPGFEASLTLQQMNGTGADESFAHGLTGGAPTALLFFGVQNFDALPFTENHAHFNMGAWANGNQFNAMVFSETGETTTNTRRALYADSVLARLNSTGNMRMRIGVDTVDATNVNVTYPLTTSTPDDYFHMLALRGCAAQVGTFDVDSTDPYTIDCTGITPKLFLPVFMFNAADANLGSMQNDAYMVIGASDGTNTVSCGITDDDNQTTTESNRVQSGDSFEEIAASNGASLSESTAAFDGESVVITATTVGDNNQQGVYLILGDEA